MLLSNTVFSLGLSHRSVHLNRLYLLAHADEGVSAQSAHRQLNKVERQSRAEECKNPRRSWVPCNHSASPPSTVTKVYSTVKM